eukprot:SM001553S01434  [mRNA]  locus=s1553:1209:2063:+ [translate_table: standard]
MANLLGHTIVVRIATATQSGTGSPAILRASIVTRYIEQQVREKESPIPGNWVEPVYFADAVVLSVGGAEGGRGEGDLAAQSPTHQQPESGVRNLDLPVVNLLLEVLGVLPVNGAANGDTGAENLLDGAGEGLGDGARAHDAGNLKDVVERNVAAVLDVLHLLAVPLGLLERLDDQRGGGGHDRHLGDAVLDGELDGDAQALPVLGRLLGDVLANLLGRQAQRPDLGRQRRRGAHLAARHAHEHLHHLRWVHLGRHGGGAGWPAHPPRGGARPSSGTLPLPSCRRA